MRRALKVLPVVEPIPTLKPLSIPAQGSKRGPSGYVRTNPTTGVITVAPRRDSRAPSNSIDVPNITPLSEYLSALKSQDPAHVQRVVEGSLPPTAPLRRDVLLHVTLVRSTIGLPEKVRKTAQSLGLRKRGEARCVPVSAVHAGQIIAIKELLRVSVVPSVPVRYKAPTGFQVLGQYKHPWTML